MKKIAFFVDSLSKGGAERVVSNLVNYFSKFDKYKVDLIILNQKEIEYEINKNVTIHYILNSNNINSKECLAKKIKNLYLKLKNTRNIVKEIEADAIVSFLPDSCFLSLAMKRKRDKVIISVRNDPKIEYKSIKNKILMKLLYPKCDGVVFQTEEAKNYFNNIIKSNSEIIANPINEDFIISPYEGARRKEIVSVGRLEKQKNFATLIYAFNSFYKENKSYKLIIYGEGKERKNLQKIIDNLGLNEVVKLPGKVDDVKERIYDATAFVLSSLYEGMPNSLMEAMAMGMPVISTDCPCGGPRFLIKQNVSGILVPVENVNLLAEAIQKVATDLDFQQKLSYNAAKISNELNPTKISRKWEEYIERVINMKDKKEKLLKKIVHGLRRRNLLNWLPDKAYIKLLYYVQFGKKINLRNPKTYNEKLQWLKLNDRKKIYTTMVDKYEAKKYVAEKIGKKYIIPTIAVYDKFEDIDFDKLPNQFVIKCTHDSGGLVICKDKENLDTKKAKEKIEESLKKNYYYNWREWPYKDVKPRIIIEKYMVDESDVELKDYKFLCFNGKPKILYVATDRPQATKINYYNLNFERLPFKQHYENFDKKIDKPKGFEKMIELAEILSKDIPNVRVDFYDINGNVYFGELTFYNCGGFEKFEPDIWDKKIGDMLNIEIKRNELNE